MLTQAIRREFLQYYKNRGHVVVPSSPVIPYEDPTLLFINAGMNQFKDVFLGKTSRDYTKAVSSQKCIRVGGKHNDLENVGHTSRHLTFFEMLGNFSFGDYFKEQAIQFAWEVSTEVFGFDPERIWPTVFRDDKEAFEIWTKYVPAERLTRFDEKDNFWMMGDVGPCGPCSELLYDRGHEFGSAKKPSEDPSGERFLEFWNLVFMQYNRQPSGENFILPKPSIDTGAGLERVLNLKVGTRSVFETDVLRSIISQIESVTGIPYHSDNKQSPAFRVIADHLRCLAFAIADGVQPSNVDRGYVLRKILRRAVRYGRILGMDQPFLARILPQLTLTMGQDYPELSKGEDRIAEILTSEEEAFIRTLRRGGNILNQVIDKAQASSTHTISGDDAFKLKDTYGLPIEEILLIAKDSDLQVDEVRYRDLEEEARSRSRSGHKNMHQVADENIFSSFFNEHGETKFLGYADLSVQSTIIGLMLEGQFVSELKEDEEGLIILAETPFYPEMGGQMGDQGVLEKANALFEVRDCQKPYQGIIAHKGVMRKGMLKISDTITASVEKERRQKIANNHTATHLLHWALHKVLGEHVKQSGSVVDAQRFRFDFSHHKALTKEEVRAIEDLVNNKIRENLPVRTYELSFEEAQKQQEIKQFFGDKYGALVRVVDIDYSKELCGGTHASFVGNVGMFRIAKEGSIAAGIRRIEAVTGKEAEELVREEEDLLLRIAEQLKTPIHQIEERLKKILDDNREHLNEISNLRTTRLEILASEFMERVVKIAEVPTLIAEIPLSIEELRLFVDIVSLRLLSGVILLGIVSNDKCHLIAKVSDDWIKKGLSANDLIKLTAPMIQGSGGGKSQIAQASGKAPERLSEALQKARDFLMEKLCIKPLG